MQSEVNLETPKNAWISRGERLRTRCKKRLPLPDRTGREFITLNAVTCIVNARSGPGHGPDLRAEIKRLLTDAGIPATVVMVKDGAEITSQARRAVERGHLIVAGGGDGTVNAVASTLVGTDKVLGVLPLGTRNHFARDLGLPLDLRGAVNTALTGRVRAVDLGEVNGQIFLNNSSLGIYSKLVRGRIAEQAHGHRKWIALAMAAVSCMRHPVPLLVRLQCDGGDPMERLTPLLLVGNNRYDMSGLHVGRRTRLDAGHLWMCVAHDPGYVGLVGLTMRALRGHLGPDDLETRSVADLWVTTQRRWVKVARDGEVSAMHSPLHYRVRPAALRVKVPG